MLPKGLKSATALVCLIALLTLAGCTAATLDSQSNTAAPVGQLTQESDRSSMIVPALWAARQSDGAMIGGLELAGIAVTTSGPPGFTIDLTDIDADGAGAAWRAATSSAAVVATMFSGTDPTKVNLNFSITGPIDGPSAGGILSVALLAALRGQSMLPRVTMTGTITPDGSIGQVGGVPTKIESAAAAGYQTVVIPLVNVKGSTRDGGEIDCVEFGAKLGVKVVPVQTLAEAFEVLTGHSFFPVSTGVYSAPPLTLEMNNAMSVAMTQRLTRAIATAPAGLAPTEKRFLADALSVASNAIAAGEFAKAYGVSAFALLRVTRAIGAASTQTVIDSRGRVAAETQLRTDIKKSLTTAEELLKKTSALPGLPYEQQLSAPSALGWVTYAIAIYRGLISELDNDTSEAALFEAGRILAEQRLNVDVMFQDAMASVLSMPSTVDVPAENSVSFLSNYTNFLIRSGQANEEYLKSLTGRDVPVSGSLTAGGISAAVHELRKIVDAIPPQAQTSQEEVAQSAYALSYYVLTSTLVANSTTYGAYDDGTENDLQTLRNQAALDSAVDSGQETVNAFAARLAASGIEASYPFWSAAWGAAVAREYRGTEYSADAGTIGLNELWYDAPNVFMLNAGGGLRVASS